MSCCPPRFCTRAASIPVERLFNVARCAVAPCSTETTNGGVTVSHISFERRQRRKRLVFCGMLYLLFVHVCCGPGSQPVSSHWTCWLFSIACQATADPSNCVQYDERLLQDIPLAARSLCCAQSGCSGNSRSGMTCLSAASPSPVRLSATRRWRHSPLAGRRICGITCCRVLAKPAVPARSRLHVKSVLQTLAVVCCRGRCEPVWHS